MNYLYEALEKPARLYIKQCPHCNLKYFGKSTRQDIEKYPGSGTHWARHLKKHKVKPIHLWNSNWYYNTSIKRFALKFSRINKIVENRTWANLREEDGLEGGFDHVHNNKELLDIAQERSRTSRKTPESRKKSSNSQLKLVQAGIHHLLSKEMAEKRKAISDKRLKEGTHNLLGQNNPSHRRVREGTHNFQDPEFIEKHSRHSTRKAIENGNHFFSSPEGSKLASETNERRIKEGSHNFLGEHGLARRRVEDGTHNLLGKVSVRTKTGMCMLVDKETYHNQTGPVHDWEYVSVRSAEAKRRKELII
jgi:hypothetical protein